MAMIMVTGNRILTLALTLTLTLISNPSIFRGEIPNPNYDSLHDPNPLLSLLLTQQPRPGQPIT